MRYCIKQPTEEVYAAISALVAAADAHIAGDHRLASSKLREANCPKAWTWLNESWTQVIRNVVVQRPVGDTKIIPKDQRDPDRNIALGVKQAVLARDGYKCRYCGLPVVHADIRKIVQRLYPDDVPWNPRVPAQQHSGFQITWLQFDHVEPHSHGGRSSVDNVVIACALCNFGKDRFTLRQLDIEDPRKREPIKSDFDGLERLRRAAVAVMKPSQAIKNIQQAAVIASPAAISADIDAFFFPGAYISRGYVNVPPINGKARWFKLGDQVQGEETTRSGVQGCLVRCARKLLDRRGIDPDVYFDAN